MSKVSKNLEEINKPVEKLRDNLDKVDVKVHDLSISAKDVANTCKKEFGDVMNYIVLQMTKIGAIITELNTHVGQAIDKNIEEGEKLAQKMEKSSEKSISVLKIKAIETEDLLSSLFQSSTSKAEEHSAKLAQRVESNKVLLEGTLDEINKKYDGKDIGLFNLKAHKQNVEGHIGELNKYKSELEMAKVHTTMQYNSMTLLYDKDSKEFKEAQEAKKVELEKLQAKTDSERSVLLEQMRIKDEKVKLEEEKVKKDEEIAAKAQKKKDELEKLKKIKEKAEFVVSIAKAVGDVAKGVATAWGLGPFIGPPMAALVAIQGAMQIKTMTEQLKYMENGGLLNGKRHAQGGMRIEGTNIEVEGGEYVVNRDSTTKNMSLLHYINGQRKELDSDDLYNFFSAPTPRFQRPEYMNRLESGGQVPIIPMSSNVEERILNAVENINFQPKVAVTDIHHAQQQMAQVDEWVGM